jgi:hypothetical protein
MVEILFAFGLWDGVEIYELPTPINAAAFAMHPQAMGGFALFETTVLLTSEESEKAKQTANKTHMVERTLDQSHGRRPPLRAVDPRPVRRRVWPPAPAPVPRLRSPRPSRPRPIALQAARLPDRFFD